MSQLLPALPKGDFKFTYLPNYLDHQPSGGGETQRINRLGDRFQMETTFKARGDQGIALIATLNANRGTKIRIPVPQPIEIGNPGSAVQANGANSGSILKMKGLTPSYAFKSGQFVTVVSNGKRYLHQIVAAVTANGSGAVTAAIVPMLRSPLLGNEAIEVAEPTIEGFMTTREGDWVQNGWLNSVAITVSVREAE